MGEFKDIKFIITYYTEEDNPIRVGTSINYGLRSIVGQHTAHELRKRLEEIISFLNMKEEYDCGAKVSNPPYPNCCTLLYGEPCQEELLEPAIGGNY